MATKYTKNADWTITSTFNVDAPNPTTQAPIQPQQWTTYSQNADWTVTSTFNTPVQPAQPVEKPQQTGTTYKQNADWTVTSTFNQPTQTVQNQNQITDWKNLTDDQKTLDNLSKLVNNRYNTQSTINWQNVNATVDGRNYGWYLDEWKNPIKNDLWPAENQSQNAPTGLIFDRNSDWSALEPNQKTINNLQKLIEARYWTLAEVEWDRVVADIWWKMYQWTLDQNGNPVKTEVPADNTQFNSGEILEQLKANPNLDLSTYDPTQASIAKNNFTKIQNFDWMNSDQLNESLQSGALLVWTEVRNNMNPQQRQIVDMVNTLNMIKWIFLDPLLINENAEKNILANAWPLAQALEDNYLSTAEVDEITITPEMKQMKNNADFWWDEMNRLRTNYEYLEDDIEEELKWQNATASYRDRYMAKEWKALYRALTTAQRNYQMYYWQYNDERERAMQLLNTNIQLYQKAQDRAYEEEQKNKEFQRQVALQNYGMVTDYMNTLEDRAYKEQRYDYEMAKELEQAQKKMDLQLQYEYWDLNSDNPMLVQQAIRRSIQGMYDTYSSLVPWLENPEISYEKVMQKIANGMSPAQALQERHDEIKNSKRLQNALANEQNKLNYDNWKMNEAMNPTSYSWYSGDSWYPTGWLTSNWWNTYISNSGKTYTYNANSWTYSDGSGTSIPSWAIVADWFSRDNPNWDYAPWIKATYKNNEIVWIQCWDFAKQRAWVWITLWDINNRRKLFTDSTPVAWWMVFFDKWYNSKYWHVAYVKAVDEGNWKILIEETNLKWNNEYWQRWVDMNNSSIYWYYNNTPAVKNNYAMNESSMIVQSRDVSKPQLTNQQENFLKQAIKEWKDPTDTQKKNVFGSIENYNQAYEDYTNYINNYNSQVWDEYWLWNTWLTTDEKVLVTAMIKSTFWWNPSEWEREYLIDLIQSTRWQWLGLTDYQSVFQWFDLLNKSEKERQEISDVVSLALYAWWDLTDLKNIAKQYRTWWINWVYRHILGSEDFFNSKDMAVTNWQMLSWLEKTYDAIQTIKLNKDKIWPVTWRLNSVLSDFFPNTDFTYIDTLLAWIQAWERKELLWTAISEHELNLIGNYLNAKTKLPPENLIEVLKVANKIMMIDYFAERASLWTNEEIAQMLKSWYSNRKWMSLVDEYITNYNNSLQVENNQTSKNRWTLKSKYNNTYTF